MSHYFSCSMHAGDFSHKILDMASYRGVACHIKLELTGYHWLNGYQKIPSSHCSPTVGSFSSLIIIQDIVDPIW